MKTVSAALDEKARVSFTKNRLSTYGKTMKLTVAGAYSEYEWNHFVESVNKLWTAANA